MLKSMAGILVVCCFVASSVRGQTRAEFQATCTTLAALTSKALDADRVEEALVYIRSAAFIRSRMNDGMACEATYFAKVVAENGVLADASAVISVGTVKPVKGWRHRDIDEFLTAVDGLDPAAVIANTKFQRAHPTVNMVKLYTQIEDLKKTRPELFQNTPRRILQDGPAKRDQRPE